MSGSPSSPSSELEGLELEVAELVDALCSMHGAHRDRLDLCESIVLAPIRRPGGRMGATFSDPKGGYQQAKGARDRFIGGASRERGSVKRGIGS